jgi:hypothetical protein
MLMASDQREAWLLVSYPLQQFWLDDNPVIQITAFYCLRQESSAVQIRWAVTNQSSELLRDVVDDGVSSKSYAEVCTVLKLAYFSTEQALQLQAINIAKPWGQEIWYTGMEERGVALMTAQGLVAPLPWVLSALPKRLCGDQLQSLVLLKILDPLPQAVFGDLYFELHQEKREVYVVTAVDEDAWPNGVGAIRFGFNQQKRESYASDLLFREAFAAAVKAYQTQRIQIDSLVDDLRQRDGFALNAPVTADQMKLWLAQVPEELSIQETVLRQDMERFTDSLPLSVGDVVKVPCLTPHSLQHGVRTVEFQTPVYERLIVSFAQKVLTQSHWDTEKACELMAIETPVQECLRILREDAGIKIELVVEFEDFYVHRVSLQPGADYRIEGIEHYCLVMAVQNNLIIGRSNLAPEQAVLLPAALKTEKISTCSDQFACFLVAHPK